jgi:Protein of unknown function (DUF2537)
MTDETPTAGDPGRAEQAAPDLFGPGAATDRRERRARGEGEVVYLRPADSAAARADPRHRSATTAVDIDDTAGDADHDAAGVTAAGVDDDDDDRSAADDRSDEYKADDDNADESTDRADWVWVQEWRAGREPTPWATGLGLTAFSALVVGVAVWVLSAGLADRPIVAVLVNLLVAGGLAPAIWLSRELPVLRWIAAGATIGVVAGWITAVLLLPVPVP